MTKQEKIDAIYKKISNKTLSPGTYLKHNDTVYFVCSVLRDSAVSDYDIIKCISSHCIRTISSKDKFDIIWKPVMIWDVLDYISDETGNYEMRPIDWKHDWEFIRDAIISRRWEMRKPIEENPQAIDYVYSLTQEQWEI